MIKIKNLDAIKNLIGKSDLPSDLFPFLLRDLYNIYLWTGYNEKTDFRDFQAELADNGYIAILEGNEGTEELETEIGLTGGFASTIPEEVQIHKFGENIWRRALVIYNNSYAMVLWIKNYDGFDSYAEMEDNITENISVKIRETGHVRNLFNAGRKQSV